MGLWLMAEDKIEVVPAVDDKFIREFVEFSIISCPVEYCTEKFANPWFFDSENKLACVSGKFAEPEIWYRHLKMYLFDRWGYKVPDEISIIADYDKGFWKNDRKRSWMVIMGMTLCLALQGCSALCLLFQEVLCQNYASRKTPD